MKTDADAHASTPKNVAPTPLGRFASCVAHVQQIHATQPPASPQRAAFTENLPKGKRPPPLGNGWKSIQQIASCELADTLAFPQHMDSLRLAAGLVKASNG